MGLVRGDLSRTVQLKLGSTTHGVDLTWTFNTSSSASAVLGSPSACPSHTSVTDVYYNNSWPVYNASTGTTYNVSTWDNSTTISSSCSAKATLSVDFSAYLTDTTTNTTINSTRSPASSSFANTTGMSQSNSSYWVNFSNPIVTSYHGSTGSRWASPWTMGSLGGPWTLTWMFNATFHAGDIYVLYTTVTSGISTLVTGYAHATAQGKVKEYIGTVTVLR